MSANIRRVLPPAPPPLPDNVSICQTPLPPFVSQCQHLANPPPLTLSALSAYALEAVFDYEICLGRGGGS